MMTSEAGNLLAESRKRKTIRNESSTKTRPLFLFQLEKKQQDPSGLFESEKEIGTGLMAIIVPRGGRV
jgi:hypothetical protein